MATPTTSITFSGLIAVLLSAALVGHASAGKTKVDFVVTACKSVSRKDHEVTEDFCVSALRSDKRSTKAKGYRDLVMVAMELLEHRAGEAMSKVDGIFRAGVKGKTALNKFRFCRVYYEAMAGTVPVCRYMVQEVGKGKGEDDDDIFPDEVIDCMNRLGKAAKDCANDILHVKEKKTLDKGTEELHKLADLTRALVKLMTGVTDDF